MYVCQFNELCIYNIIMWGQGTLKHTMKCMKKAFSQYLLLLLLLLFIIIIIIIIM